MTLPSRLIGCTVGIAVVALCLTVNAHERKDVAGLEVEYYAVGVPAAEAKR